MDVASAEVSAEGKGGLDWVLELGPTLPGDLHDLLKVVGFRV